MIRYGQPSHPWSVHLPAGAATGSLVDGAAAVSVGVGLGAAAGVGASVFALVAPLSFMRLKSALSLSIASGASGCDEMVNREKRNVFERDWQGRMGLNGSVGGEKVGGRRCSGGVR